MDVFLCGNMHKIYAMDIELQIVRICLMWVLGFKVCSPEKNSTCFYPLSYASSPYYFIFKGTHIGYVQFCISGIK